MRTLVRISALLLLVSASLSAQTGSGLSGSVSLGDLDFSTATISQAGPTSFYVRGVGLEGERYSFLLGSDQTGVWSVAEIIPESANILPPDAILDFATISMVDAATIRIDGVLVGDQAYGGALTVGEDADLALAGSIELTSLTINKTRAEAVAALTGASSDAEFEARLAEERAKLQAEIAAVKAERDTLEAERDALEEQLAEAQSGEITLESVSSDLESPVSGEQVVALIKERDQLAGDIVGLVMENNDLRADKDTLEGQIGTLQDQNTRLKDDVDTMTSEVGRLQELVQAYRSGVPAPAPGTEEAGAEVTSPAAWSAPGDYLRRSDLQTATDAMSRELASAQTAIGAELDAAVEAIDSRLDDATNAMAAELDAAAAEVTAELRNLGSRVAALEAAAAGLAELEASLRTSPAAPAAALPTGAGDDSQGDTPTTPPTTPAPRETAGAETVSPKVEGQTPSSARTGSVAVTGDTDRSAELAEVQAELAALFEENRRLMEEKQALEDRVLQEILNNGFVAIMRERLTRQVVSGFGGADPDTGSWSVEDRLVVQRDPDAYFAKIAIPAAQSDSPVLYSFRARALDSGWAGVGIHLFVSEVERRRGYGMGKSLLVWLTRDPEVRKTETTYLQLYRSDDDVSMGRVLDAAIPESLGDYVRVEVLYEPATQYLTVAVNGQDKVRYRTWFGIHAGLEVALRTLGRAEFRDFAVTTAP